MKPSRPGGDRNRSPGACCLLPAAGGADPPLRFLNQPSPSVLVEVLAATIRADERTEPGPGPVALLDALQWMLAMRAIQIAAHSIVRLQACGCHLRVNVLRRESSGH